MLRLLALLSVLLWPAMSAAEANGATVFCGDRGMVLLMKCQELAENGDAEAQESLGTMYLNGEGVPADIAQAVEWFRKAADQGNASSQYNLGLFFMMGMGVPLDYVQAHFMFNLSAVSGDKKAIESREEVAKMMTPAQIEEAEGLARQWSARHEKK